MQGFMLQPSSYKMLSKVFQEQTGKYVSVSITFPRFSREMQIVDMVWGKEKHKTIGCL